MRDSRRINWSLLAFTRFGLAFIVMNVHLVNFCNSPFSRLMTWFDGKAAVVGFLVISGYSISASLERAPNAFIIRRFIRIYPAYVFAIIFGISLQLVLGSYSTPRKAFEAASPLVIVANLLFMQMYLTKAIAFVGTIWSLSLEFSYYIMAWARPRFPAWAIPVLALCSVALFLAPGNLSRNAVYQAVHKANMVRYVWPFLLGMLLYHRPSRTMFVAAALAGAVLMAVSPTTPEPLAAASYCGVIAALFVADRGLGRVSLAGDWLGDVSYTLYLVHLPLFIAIHAFWKLTDPLTYTVAALAFAAAVTAAVETPFRKRLTRLGSFRTRAETEALDDLPRVKPLLPAGEIGARVTLSQG